VLDWSTYSGKGVFGRYLTVRSPGGAPPVVYPPTGSVAGVAGTTIRAASSGYDPTGAGYPFWYRTLAVSKDGKVLAASDAPGPVGDAGGAANIASFSAAPDPYDSTLTDFSWTPFVGSSKCFSEYKIFSISTSWTDELTGIPPGTGDVEGLAITCTGQKFEIQVIRDTSLGQLVVARSATVTCG
jgi:hypothetical protein